MNFLKDKSVQAVIIVVVLVVSVIAGCIIYYEYFFDQHDKEVSSVDSSVTHETEHSSSQELHVVLNEETIQDCKMILEKGPQVQAVGNVTEAQLRLVLKKVQDGELKIDTVSAYELKSNFEQAIETIKSSKSAEPPKTKTRTHPEFSVNLSSDLYFEKKGKLLELLKAFISKYDSTSFSNSLKELVDLRMKFTSADDDMNAAHRIPLATAESTKATVYSLLKSHIIQSHEMIFTEPQSAETEQKLANMMKIRRELGFKEFGQKEFTSLDAFRVDARNKAFDRFVLALKSPGTSTDGAKKALLDAFRNIGPISYARIPFLPYHLAIFEREEARLTDKLILRALSMYLLPLYSFEIMNRFVFNRVSPSYHFTDFVAVCKRFDTNLAAKSEEEVLEIVYTRACDTLKDFDVFREKLAALAINRHCKNPNTKVPYERLLQLDTINLNYFLGDKPDAEEPSYQVFKRVINTLYKGEGKQILGFFGDLIVDEPTFQKELAERLVYIHLRSLIASGRFPENDLQLQTEIESISAQFSTKKVSLSPTHIRNRFLAFLCLVKPKSLSKLSLNSKQQEELIAQVNEWMQTCLKNRSYEGFKNFFLALKNIYTEIGQNSEVDAIINQLTATISAMQKEALKSLTKENGIILNFIKQAQNLIGTTGYRLIEQAGESIFASVLDSMTKKKLIFLEKEPLFPNLQTYVRYYLGLPWDKTSISIRLSNSLKDSSEKSIVATCMRILAIYRYQPYVIRVLKNIENYTNRVFEECRAEFLESVMFMKNKNFGYVIRVNFMSKLPSKLIAPFWLARKGISLSAMRKLCSIPPAEKQAISVQTKSAIEAYLSKVSPKRTELIDALKNQIQRLQNEA